MMIEKHLGRADCENSLTCDRKKSHHQQQQIQEYQQLQQQGN
jgi:hypothetical protein